MGLGPLVGLRLNCGLWLALPVGREEGSTLAFVHLERNWVSRYLGLVGRKVRKEGCLGL